MDGVLSNDHRGNRSPSSRVGGARSDRHVRGSLTADLGPPPRGPSIGPLLARYSMVRRLSIRVMRAVWYGIQYRATAGAKGIV
ncbi:MAG TPA: hypothetical protein PK677_12190 [Acidiphilium sp.]|nr:hypothetical protein [Acidiphilium sp.]HQU24561.1 hypothetical protein [Acidiphilium sp.]